MIPSNNFRPWRRDYAFGMTMLLSGVAISWGASIAGHIYIAAVSSVLLTYTGCARVLRGAGRERGFWVEQAAVERMRAVLVPKGFGVRADIKAMWIGNIDSVVKPPWTEARYVVEIKSFKGIVRRFYGLTKPGKYYRLQNAVRQVRRQCRYLGEAWHFPVLWMPESKLNMYFEYKGILVVNGDVHLLDSAMRYFDRKVQLPAKITFRRQPPAGYINYVKGLGFQYNKKTWQWHGRICKGKADIARSKLSPADGTIAFLSGASD